MRVIDRLMLLKDSEFKIKHKALGLCKMEFNFDLIRIRGIKEGRTHKQYCEFLYAETLNEGDMSQGISEDILNKEITHEEVWMISPHLALDMFVNI